jgi:hypothetical protein
MEKILRGWKKQREFASEEKAKAKRAFSNSHSLWPF